MSTTYLGLELPHPLMPGASPLSDDLDGVKRLEDAGAAAIVMRSLFEEQLRMEHGGGDRPMERYEESFSDAIELAPNWIDYRLGPDEYLEQLHRIRSAVEIPVIASINGSNRGGWLHFGRLMQQAGANALELNVYHLATDFVETAGTVEREVVEMVETVKEHLSIPVAVKLSPFYSAFPSFALALDRAGADGLVLFNRFFQPDIDVEELEARRAPELSDSTHLRLRLRWLAILSGRLKASLAASGGVHTATDVVKALMSGAHAVQMVSALLQRGPEHLAVVHRELAAWLEDHGYETPDQVRGSMSLDRCPDPGAYERANYMETLQSWTS
jgi:dihydroorotate dehydrogenase (fumarate)